MKNKGHIVVERRTAQEPSTDWRNYAGHGSSDPRPTSALTSRRAGWRYSGGPMSLQEAKKRVKELKKMGVVAKIIAPGEKAPWGSV